MLQLLCGNDLDLLLNMMGTGQPTFVAAAAFIDDVDVRDYFRKKGKGGEVKEDHDIKESFPKEVWDLASWFEPTCQPAFA